MGNQETIYCRVADERTGNPWTTRRYARENFQGHVLCSDCISCQQEEGNREAEVRDACRRAQETRAQKTRS